MKQLVQNLSEKSISFIEPDKCISLNREITHLIEDEKEEISSITESITESLSILIDKKLDLFSSTVNNK